jgi:hypothetical protein
MGYYALPGQGVVGPEGVARAWPARSLNGAETSCQNGSATPSAERHHVAAPGPGEAARITSCG